MHTLIGHVVTLHQLQDMCVDILINISISGSRNEMLNLGLRDIYFVSVRPPGLPLATVYQKSEEGWGLIS